MRTKRFLAGVAVLALVGGCAEQIKQLEPALELRTAMQHLAAAKQAGFTLKFTGSADDLIAALKQQQAKDKDADAWTDDDTTSMRTLLNSAITVAYDQAGPGTQDDRVQLAATVDGVAGTELRVVDKTLYAKAPVAELAAKFGASAGDLASTRREITATVPSIGPLFDGGWVSLDVKNAADLPAATLGLPVPKASDAKTLEQLKTSASHLSDGATITRDSADPKHIVVTSSTTKAYAELKSLVSAVSTEQGQDLDDEFGNPPKDRPIAIDFWIDDQKLTAVEVNLLQFVDGATGHAALHLDMTTGAAISAPQGASKIDPAVLTQLAGAPAGGTVPAGLSATEAAAALGYATDASAQQAGDKPADHLKEATTKMLLPGATARIVRPGVAEVTAHGAKACLKLPASYTQKPVVGSGAC